MRDYTYIKTQNLDQNLPVANVDEENQSQTPRTRRRGLHTAKIQRILLPRISKASWRMPGKSQTPPEKKETVKFLKKSLLFSQNFS